MPMTSAGGSMVPPADGRRRPARADTKVIVTAVEATQVEGSLQDDGFVALSINHQEAHTDRFEGKDTYWGNQYEFFIDSGAKGGDVMAVEVRRGKRVVGRATVQLLERAWSVKERRWFSVLSAAGERQAVVVLECVSCAANPVERSQFQRRSSEGPIVLDAELSWRRQRLAVDMASRGDQSGVPSLSLAQRADDDAAGSPVYTARTHISGESAAAAKPRSAAAAADPARPVQQRLNEAAIESPLRDASPGGGSSGGSEPAGTDAAIVDRVAGILSLSGEEQMRRAMEDLLREHGRLKDAAEEPRGQPPPRPHPSPNTRARAAEEVRSAVPQPLRNAGQPQLGLSDAELRVRRSVATTAQRCAREEGRPTTPVSRRPVTPLCRAAAARPPRRSSPPSRRTDAFRTPPRRGPSPCGDGAAGRRRASAHTGRPSASRSPRAARRGLSPHRLPPRLAHLDPAWDPGETGGSMASVQSAPAGCFSRQPAARRAARPAVSPSGRTVSPCAAPRPVPARAPRHVPTLVRRLGEFADPGCSVTSTQSQPLPLSSAARCPPRSDADGRRERIVAAQLSALSRVDVPPRSPQPRPARTSFANPTAPRVRSPRPLGPQRAAPSPRSRRAWPAPRPQQPQPRGAARSQEEVEREQRERAEEEKRKLLLMLTCDQLSGPQLRRLLPAGAADAQATGDELLDFEAMEKLCCQ
eukprot:TRINITY_DN16242_c0_g1_i1.p1 TRINITY_DN16242_c0_g1~~TRINITY_DN16242_c0_g1_i1.p1  ORF type:complete len:720 (+),score=271.43 TRINITY_DN16242_c0_g1_i1:69-2162(+)